MHEAYNVHSLLTLSYQVESIAAYNDNILVGTRQGHLFMYSVNRSEEKCQVQLERYNKSFSKKAIQQLEVVPEHNILISLTDNLIQLHDLNSITLTTVCQIAKTKGATFFTVNVHKETSLTGEIKTLIRVAVVVKRKIQLYYLKNNELHVLDQDISLPDVPRCMVWCEKSICVGYKGEYALIDLAKDGKQTDLFPTSSVRSSEPCIVRVSDNTFALCRESQTVLVNVEGQTERNKALKWSDVPLTLAWDEPYAIGVLAECVEVQTLEPNGQVQLFPELQKVRFLVCCQQGVLYAASLSQIWCIQAVDVAKQTKVLLDTKQFQLALKLTMTSNENEDDKTERIHQIHTLLAYDLFTNKQFHDSMREFLKLGTDPCDVIRLFPDLLPQQQQQSSQNADGIESSRDLTEKELETGLLALIEYLIEIRNRLHSEPKGSVNARGNLNEKEPTHKSTQQLLQIIDTTLLKCYLQTNDALVAPLLRLNHCHLGETEKILKKKKKHNELIILYQKKGQHRRALELLKSMHMLDKTINYLQHLGTENIALILEFSEWVLDESLDEGLKIFTEDVAEVEALPRPRVLDFLLKQYPTLAIPYLEHVVHVWKDTNTFLHNALIHEYREKIKKDPTSTHTRTKLLKFLENSSHYAAENILSQFPTDDLQERAIILGRLGKHDQALAIYVRVLGDLDQAKIYCEKVYSQKIHGYEKVYTSLINLILNPNSCQLSKGTTLSAKTSQPDLELALSLLEKHADALNPLEVLNVLPDSVPVSRIHKFLLAALHKVTSERRSKELMQGLLYAELVQCKKLRLELQAQRVLVTDVNVCPVCKKRFGNQSALVRYPDGDLVHFSCHERK